MQSGACVLTTFHLIRGVRAVGISVTFPGVANAPGAVNALELVDRAGTDWEWVILFSECHNHSIGVWLYGQSTVMSIEKTRYILKTDLGRLESLVLMETALKKKRNFTL